MNSGCAPLFESFYVKIVITLQHMWYFSNSVGFGPTSETERIVPKDHPYFSHPLQVQGVPRTTLSSDNLRGLTGLTDSSSACTLLLVIVHNTERVQIKISQKKKCVAGTWCTQEKY